MTSGRLRRPASAGALALVCLCATVRPSLGAQSPPPEWADEAARTADLIRRAVADGAAAGKRERVSVTFAGRSEYVTVVGASEAALLVRTRGIEAPVPWSRIEPERLYRIGTKYLPGDAATRARLARFCLVNGLVKEADEELGRVLRTAPESRADIAAELGYLQVLRGPKSSPEPNDGAPAEEAAEQDIDEPQNADKDPVAAWYGGGVHAKGKVVRSAYVRHACSWDLQTMHRRLGPDYEFFQKLDAKAGKGRRTAGSGREAKPDEFPTVPMATPKRSNVGCNGQGFTYEVGGPPSDDPGDFSGTQGQVLYAPDQKNDPGVDRVDILGMGHMCYQCAPRPPWWGTSHPEPGTRQRSWEELVGGTVGMPLAVTRGFGGFRSCNSLMLFASGLVGSAGTNTSDNKYPCAIFPRHKVPTAIASANNNEFALVTVWDVKELKGQLAVLALGSHHADFWDLDWKVLMPCFPNGGGHTFIKLLGYVDLPGMDAPTGVGGNSRIGGRTGWLQLLGGGNANPPQIDLSRQEVRDSFTTPRGVNRNWVPTTGYAAVISRSEKKVAFVDLGPLFMYARMMYLGTQENYDKTLDVGPRPDQWPYTFEHEPRWRPRVVKVVDLPQMPTAVLPALNGDADARCHVATVDGRLFTFRVDGLTGPVPRPDLIAPMSVVKVGKNPCWLAYHKNHWGGPNPETMEREILVVSRGDREVLWVRYSGWNGEVYRRLRDSRLVDPVHVEVADNHGTCGYVVTVCDFKGRKILNYRYGPVIFHTNGGAVFELPPGDGPDGRAEFECGGVMGFPGYPFQMSAANVP